MIEWRKSLSGSSLKSLASISKALWKRFSERKSLALYEGSIVTAYPSPDPPVWWCLAMVINGYSKKASVVLSEARWGPGEGRIRLDLGDMTLRCFSPLPPPGVEKQIDARVGNSIDVYLSLYTHGPEVTDSRKKSIQELPRGRSPNRYEISGQVVEKALSRYTNSDSHEFVAESIVIDCGVPVHIIRHYSTDGTVEPHRFEEGDWVRAIGRMDVRFPAISKALRK